jgi:hypothetical protein
MLSEYAKDQMLINEEELKKLFKFKKKQKKELNPYA